MTGTIEGLRAVTSCEGYQHLGLVNLRQSAALGCQSCKKLLLPIDGAELELGLWSPIVLHMDISYLMDTECQVNYPLAGFRARYLSIKYPRDAAS